MSGLRRVGFYFFLLLLQGSFLVFSSLISLSTAKAAGGEGVKKNSLCSRAWSHQLRLAAVAASSLAVPQLAQAQMRDPAAFAPTFEVMKLTDGPFQAVLTLIPSASPAGGKWGDVAWEFSVLRRQPNGSVGVQAMVYIDGLEKHTIADTAHGHCARRVDDRTGFFQLHCDYPSRTDPGALVVSLNVVQNQSGFVVNLWSPLEGYPLRFNYAFPYQQSDVMPATALFPRENFR